MEAEGKGGGLVFSSAHVLMPSNCMSLDDGKLPIAGAQSKDFYASGDEMIPKVRKPYTITKQRERWSEEEHKKFLEALKLHGRAWRLIEEQVGTKTAVQIRSHAQKFFSKVVRESSTNSSSIKSIEIPPPRPKRKPMHPYPRKSVPSSTKVSLVSEKADKSLIPIPFVSEKEIQSPSSVLSAVGSDTMGSTISNPMNGCSSPVSSATRPNPVDFFAGEQENGSPLNTSTFEKDRFLSPFHISASSSQQDKSSMESETGYEENHCNKEASSSEMPTTCLKLFGTTVLVTESHKPSSSVVGNTQHHKKSPIQTYPENQEDNKEEHTSQGSATHSAQCLSSWNPWLGGVPPVYCWMQLKQEDSETGVSSAIPWWVCNGNIAFPPVLFHNMHLRQTASDSCKQASNDKESIKEGSLSGSNMGSSGEHGLGDRDSDTSDSQNGEKLKEPIAVVGLKPSERLTFSCQQFCSSNNLEKKPTASFCSEASESSVFKIRPLAIQDCGKGFVPYKRCVTERDVQQAHVGSNEREGQRIWLCQ